MKKSILCCAVLALLVPVAASGAVVLLWNAVMPSLLGAATIGFGQALCLFLLSQLLSGGILLGLLLWWALLHHLLRHRTHVARRRWGHMTDEQRREFIHQWREMRFGHYPSQPHDDHRTTTEGNGSNK